MEELITMNIESRSQHWTLHSGPTTVKNQRSRIVEWMASGRLTNPYNYLPFNMIPTHRVPFYNTKIHARNILVVGQKHYYHAWSRFRNRIQHYGRIDHGTKLIYYTRASQHLRHYRGSRRDYRLLIICHHGPKSLLKMYHVKNVHLVNLN
ncbi:hypothetical protein AKO1_008285 [Acrasis kona]|uniref:Uncharacterized protein n=1 Tax=Acrasis kona TaxID=1008807 RepID=A0AAW2YNC2_9EUKA